METVTVNGKVYQVNKPYVCVDTGKIGYLCNDVVMDNKPFQLSVRPNFNPQQGGEVILANEIDLFELGTIEDAPIELEDGKFYKFFLNGSGCIYLGQYFKNRRSFFSGGNKVCGEGEAIDIEPLMVKA